MTATEPAIDDRIAALIADREGMARKHPDLADRYDGPSVRRSIALSVAIQRAVPGLGNDYSALINTAHAWWPTAGRADTPEAMAAWTREHRPHLAERTAQLADAVAGHIEATAADLRDDGATAAAWRTYARALRGAP